MSKFLPLGRINWIDPEKFNLNNYNKNNSKVSVIEVDLDFF